MNVAVPVTFNVPESTIDDGVIAPSVMVKTPVDVDKEPEMPVPVIELTNDAQVVPPAVEMVVTAFPFPHAVEPPYAANCPAVEEATCSVPVVPTEEPPLLPAELIIVELEVVDMVMFVPAVIE